MMNNGIRFLASMKFAFWSLVSLIAWFLLGAVLYKTDAFTATFHSMNDLMILDWLIAYSKSDVLVLLWFAGLCICGFSVALSFTFCSTTTLYRNFVKLKGKLSYAILFLMHLVFILIVLMHVLSMIIGFKYGHQKVFSGDIIEFPNTYRLHVDTVHFVDDPAVLKDKKSYAKIRMTKENFTIDENRVHVSLYKADRFLGEGSAYFLKPLCIHTSRLTIEKFIYSEKRGTSSIGAVICLSNNPLLWPFFVVYGLAVLLLAFYAVLVLKKTT